MRVERIAAVTVNQNTSDYTELMLRSLFARHANLEGIAITVMDNNSDDDMESLRSFASSKGIPILPTPWRPETPGNNHGENLRDFVLGHPDCGYFLFLDTDIVFVQDETIPTMLRELKAGGDEVWAIQAQFTKDGVRQAEWGSLDKGGSKKFLNIMMEDSIEDVQPGKPLKHMPLPAIMGGRIFPMCCLVRNTRAFFLTAREIGFSCAHLEESGGGKVYDTMGLATQVMKTHGLRYVLSSRIIRHFWGIACNQRVPEKDAVCRKMLSELRLRLA